MKFEEAVKLNDLGLLIDEQYGEWGHFHKEAADIIWAAAVAETRSQYFSYTLASMLSVTMMNESTFRLDVAPNTNTKKRPENIHCPSAWDFGPNQINFFWNVLDAWEGNVVMRGLNWRLVFGKPPYEPDKPFTGDPLYNTRACARIMLSKSTLLEIGISSPETQVVKYTGGDAARMEHRRSDWRKYGRLFETFYEEYKR